MPTIDELLGNVDKNKSDKFADYMAKNMMRDIAKLGWAKRYKKQYEKEYRRKYKKNAYTVPDHLSLEGVLALTAVAGMVNFDQKGYDSIKEITLDDLKHTEFPKMEKEYKDLMELGENALKQVEGERIADILMKYHTCKKALEYF